MEEKKLLKVLKECTAQNPFYFISNQGRIKKGFYDEISRTFFIWDTDIHGKGTGGADLLTEKQMEIYLKNNPHLKNIVEEELICRGNF